MLCLLCWLSAVVVTSWLKMRCNVRLCLENSPRLLLKVRMVMGGAPRLVPEAGLSSLAGAEGGGYATGAGLYDGEDDATVAAVPYSGYQLVSFTGGPVGGSSSQFSGKNQYSFNIQLRDWKFTVSFKKEYTVTVSAGTGGTVSGGGKVLDGSSCTVTARANSGYSFDGWYEGSSKVSSSASYTFTVSSNRTLCFHLT